LSVFKEHSHVKGKQKDKRQQSMVAIIFFGMEEAIVIILSLIEKKSGHNYSIHNLLLVAPDHGQHYFERRKQMKG